MNNFNGESSNGITEKNVERIKIMARLAIYDKTFGEDDKKANDLYYRDYVYRKNFNYRLAFLLGYIMMAIFYIVATFLDPSIDLYNFDFMQFGINLSIGAGIMLLAATLIGSLASSSDYKRIKYRLKGYFSLMNELERLDQTRGGLRSKRPEGLQPQNKQRKEIEKRANTTRSPRDSNKHR
ncbi:MAG: hypothetical protein FWE02_07755 [Defluviitaleaceae bacterium]|nr:hypothetical protein [Defluviitaleaceae bacterium]